MPMKSMQMSFEATCQCAFLYEQWSTTKDECGTYLWALVLIGLYSFAVDSLPTIKDWYRAKVCDQDGKILGVHNYALLAVLEGIWVLGSLISMLLLMSFNVGVILVILGCKAICYLTIGLRKDLKTNSHYH